MSQLHSKLVQLQLLYCHGSWLMQRTWMHNTINTIGEENGVTQILLWVHMGVHLHDISPPSPHPYPKWGWGVGHAVDRRIIMITSQDIMTHYYSYNFISPCTVSFPSVCSSMTWTLVGLCVFSASNRMGKKSTDFMLELHSPTDLTRDDSGQWVRLCELLQNSHHYFEFATLTLYRRHYCPHQSSPALWRFSCCHFREGFLWDDPLLEQHARHFYRVYIVERRRCHCSGAGGWRERLSRFAPWHPNIMQKVM